MAANYLIAQPQVSNPAAAFMGGMGGMQNIYGQQQKNYLLNLQAQQQQQEQEGLAEWGKTGDLEVLKRTAPKVYMAVDKFVSSMGADKRQTLMDNIKIFDSRKGMYVDNPESYAEDFNTVDPEFRKSLLAPDKFEKLDAKGRRDYLFQKEIMAKTLTQAMTPYQAARLGIEQQKVDRLETPDQKMGRAVATTAAKEDIYNRSPRFQNIDPETGLPMGPGKFVRPPASQNPVEVLTEDEAKARGTVPKGARIVKNTDPEYTAARHEAATAVNANPRYMNLPDDKRLAKIDDLTNQIIKDRSSAKAGRRAPSMARGAQPPTGAPAGAVDTGKTSGGKRVYELPNGNYWTE